MEFQQRAEQDIEKDAARDFAKKSYERKKSFFY